MLLDHKSNKNCSYVISTCCVMSRTNPSTTPKIKSALGTLSMKGSLGGSCRQKESSPKGGCGGLANRGGFVGGSYLTEYTTVLNEDPTSIFYDSLWFDPKSTTPKGAGMFTKLVTGVLFIDNGSAKLNGWLISAFQGHNVQGAWGMSYANCQPNTSC